MLGEPIMPLEQFVGLLHQSGGMFVTFLALLIALILFVAATDRFPRKLDVRRPSMRRRDHSQR
jgi:hypothetical protein